MKSNMKKIFKTLGVMLAATLSLTNCTEELKNAPVAEQDRSYSIYAEQVETRTTNDGLSTKWAKGDSVNVFYADAGYLNYSENSKFVLADAETGLFETDYLKGNLSAVNDWFVLYPYNENIYTPANTSSGYLPVGAKAADVQIQIYKDNMKHIAGGNYPMWGTALAVPYEEAPHVVMSHLSSLLEINVTNNTEEAIAVNSVTFMAPEDITGTYYIDITGDEPYYTSSGANYVSGVARLAVGGADQIAPGESGKFYLAIKPFTAQANTELILDVNGQTKYIYLDNDVTFSAGKIKTLNFDYTQAVEVEAGPYTSNMIWELGSKAYDHAATINGTPDVPVLKLGTSEVPGTASIYVPGDAVKIGFYAVSWNEKPAVVALKKGSSLKSYFGAPVNENASGNSPYELTVNDKVSYYEMVLPESVSADCVLTTIGDNTRVIIWGLNYYTEDGIGEDQVIADPEKVTVAEFLEAEEDATLYELTGTIERVSSTKYGNFYLTDDSGSVYIYGLVDEAGAYIFSSLELKEGDVLTVVGRRASYKGNPQMVDALYVKHEIGESSDPDAEAAPYTSNLEWELGSNAYDHAATINGTPDVPVLKLGTTKAAGSATVTVPADAVKIGFYAVAWKGSTATVELRLDDQVVGSSNVSGNDGATSNSPYTINVGNTSAYHEIEVSQDTDTEYTITTSGKQRVIIWGLNYYTADGIGGEQGGTTEPEQPSDPVLPSEPADIADGDYWIIADGNVAMPLLETQKYGYLQATAAVDGASTAENAFTFKSVGNGLYTIQDSYGRYLYQTGTYNNYNVSADLVDNNEYYWSIAVSGTEYLIMNAGVEKFIQYDTNYGSYGSYATYTGVLPTLVSADNPISPEDPAPEDPEQGGDTDATTTISVIFSDYTPGIQYATDEEHVINEDLTIYVNDGHFTSQLRLYESSSHDSVAWSSELPGFITSMTLNAGYNSATLKVYGSADGINWTLVNSKTVVKAYADYTVAFPEDTYSYFKLDAEENQVRVASLGVTYKN